MSRERDKVDESFITPEFTITFTEEYDYNSNEWSKEGGF